MKEQIIETLREIYIKRPDLDVFLNGLEKLNEDELRGLLLIVKDTFRLEKKVNGLLDLRSDKFGY